MFGDVRRVGACAWVCEDKLISTIDPTHIGRHSCLPLPGDALLGIRLSPSPPDRCVVIDFEHLRVFKQRVANAALGIVGGM